MRQSVQERLNELAQKASEVSKAGLELADRLDKTPGLEATRSVVLESLSEIRDLMRSLTAVHDRSLTDQEEAALGGLFSQYEQMHADFKGLSTKLDTLPDRENH